jgi:potassium efflux system protein
LACVLAGLLIPAIASGQAEESGSQEAPPAALPDLEAAKQKIEKDTDLPKDLQAKALELYERAEKAAAEAKQVESENQALQNRVDAAPARIAALREQLDQPPAPWAPPTDAGIEELQTLVSQKGAELLAARDAASGRKDAKTALEQASTTLLDRFVELERSVRRLDEELAAPPAAAEPPILQQARREFLIARRMRQQALLGGHRLRTFNHDLLVELASREYEAALAQFTLLESQSRELDRLLQVQREVAAQKEQWEAAATLATTAELPQPIATIAEENAEFKADIARLIERENLLNEELRDAGRLIRELDENLLTLRERVDLFGASQAIGRLLQRRLHLLPSTLEYRQRARQRNKEIAEVLSERIDIEDQRRILSEVETEVDAVMASIPPEQVASNEKALRDRTTELLTSKRDTLTDLHDAYSRYMTRLVAVDSAEKEIAKIVGGMTDFIRKQLLWIPTLPPISPDDFAAAPSGLTWLFSVRNWAEAIKEAARSFVFEPLSSALSLLLLILVLAIRRIAKFRLPQLAEKTRRIRTDSFTHTLKALAYTLVAALAWPAFLAFFASLLKAEPTPDDAFFSFAVADALWSVLIFAYVLGLLRWLTKPFGLGPRHFRWSVPVCALLHARLGWLPWVLIPLAVVSNIATESFQLEYVVGLARPALIAGLLAIAVFIWRSFTRTGPFGEYLLEREESWLARLWFMWFPILLGIPVAISVLSGLGYQVAAGTLTSLIFGDTMFLLIGLRLIHDVLNRWFNVAERRSRLEAALRQREEARAERGQEEPESISGFEIEVPEVDYQELGEQARTVIRVVVFLALILSIGTIWGELLPTLGLLERVELPFSKMELVDGVEQQIPVNLSDIFIGLLILAVTLFAAKNLSGLLEFTFLRRLRLDTGGNYAIVTLCQYVIVAIGVMVALSTIGMQWSKLQWLVAALGVGLGFGLQEIVANFVSGIILLLERPVRIGDIVSVGNADGFISKIRIRATTILTWEKKELIIPNKEFITGQVLNWTLSDSLNRILLSVGVAYGSDVRRALEIMKEAATENDNVVADPEPVVTFEEFGDNALTLNLRCYISSLEQRLVTVTALHQAVYDKFGEAGIVIAFPQRDVHLDTSKPLEIKVSRSNKQPGPS